jgi:putative component of membrane protein insertase Oxa1/YidC/SpoIIIJ protein YidD
MKSLAAASVPQQIAIALIAGYQKHISPQKGFSCAHRLLHGGESCSQYIKRLIAQEGLVEAVRASRQRFQACREANEILNARSSYRCQNEDSPNPEQKTKRRRQRRRKTSSQPVHNDSGPIEEIADCVDLGSELGCEVADCNVSGSDCSTTDCGSRLECGALDCGSADCCSWG